MLHFITFDKVLLKLKTKTKIPSPFFLTFDTLEDMVKGDILC